jgi:ADP-heptose:LPS heptosyltransferase
MKLRKMRWVDHWVGMPVCFTLGICATLARKILGQRKRAITGEHPLAVFKFFGLGSIMEATPLLRAVRSRYPQARLIFVTFSSNELIISRLNVCDELRVIRTDSALHFVFDVLQTIVWLKCQRTEAVIDLEFFSKFSTLLSFLSRAAIRVGFHLNDFWRYSLVTHPIYFNYFRHISDVYEEAGRRLDVTISDRSLSRIGPTEAEAKSVRQFLGKHGWSEGKVLLGININAGELCPERRWPIENWKVLITALLERNEDMYIVLTGSPDERAHVESVRAGIEQKYHERIIIAAGSLSLMEFAAGLSLFAGFVTGDSGPLHMAAAHRVPIVSIWGPSRPAFYCPRTDNIRCIFKDYHCSPCVCMFTTFEGMWCNHEAWCMQVIEHQAVLEAVEGMLAETDEKQGTDKS